MSFSSFLYGPRANIIATEVMGFIYTGFRPSHFEVMVVTDSKLVFIQIFSHSQVTDTIVFFSLQLSSYIPSWRLQKNADVISQAWVICGTSMNWIFLWIKLFYLVRTLVPAIYMANRSTQGNIEWMIIVARNGDLLNVDCLIIDTLNLQIPFYYGLQAIMRCSLPLHQCVLPLLEFTQSVTLFTIDESDSIYILD